jgi:hypothetical protein
MALKSTNKSDNLNERVSFRLSKRENAALIKYCKKNRIVKSSFVRNLILANINDFQAQ